MLKRKIISAILATVITALFAILTSCTNTPSDVVSDLSELDEASAISSAEEPSDDTSGEEPITEPVLQTEMTDEMWEIWFKQYGCDDEYDYAYKTIGILNDYLYLGISRLTKDGVATPLGSCYQADEYIFLGYSCGESKIGYYLFADKKFITFEEGYEAGLFKAADAYTLLEELYGDEVGLVAGIDPQYDTSGK